MYFDEDVSKDVRKLCERFLICTEYYEPDKRKGIHEIIKEDCLALVTVVPILAAIVDSMDKDNFRRELGWKIRNARKELNMSRDQLGSEAGVYHEYIDKLEHGLATLDHTKIKWIANVLVITMEELGLEDVTIES